MVQVTDAVSQRANREVLGCVRQQIPDQPLTYTKEPRIAVIACKRTDAETASHNHQWALCHAECFCVDMSLKDKFTGCDWQKKINLCLQQSKRFMWTFWKCVLCGSSALYMYQSQKAEPLRTWFVGVFCHPGDGDASNLRVAEPQQESAVGFGHQHVLCLLLVYKAQNGPADTHSYTLKHHRCTVTSALCCPHPTSSATAQSSFKADSRDHFSIYHTRQINLHSRFSQKEHK